MDIAVTGTGGVGNTSFAATLARIYAEDGRKVLAADADPDANLGAALGFPEEVVESIIPISKMRKMIEERTGADKDNTFYVPIPKSVTFRINTECCIMVSGFCFWEQ